MPAWLQAVLLGIVQGVTEFFPVSSDGHLVLVPYLAGWETPGLAFDVALHAGTLAAILLYFRREIAAILGGLVGIGPADPLLSRRLATLIVLGTIPVVVVGLLAEDLVAGELRDPRLASAFLLVTAVMLVTAERLRDRRVHRAEEQRRAREAAAVWDGSWIGSRRERERRSLGGLPVGEDRDDPLGDTLAEIGVGQALLVGLLQPLALLPGLSRSGSTIVAGVLGGLTREAATRFSFLLALPALAGALVLSLPDLAAPGPYPGSAIVAGIGASFVAGYLAIHLLVRLVARERLTLFAAYCVLAAAVGLIGYLALGPPGTA